MAKSAEYLLVTATVGAVMMLVGSMSWTGVAKLVAVFAHIAHVLQVAPSAHRRFVAFLSLAGATHLCTARMRQGPHHRLALPPNNAIATLYQRRDPIDLVTVTDVLRLRGHLDKIGGSLYLAELMEVAVTSANVAHYARIVKDKAMLRAAIDIGSEISAQAYGQDDLQEIISRAQGGLNELTDAQSQAAFTDMPSLMIQTIHAVESVDHASYISSGFPDLNAKINGFYPGDLILLAARPSLGKTSLALQFAVTAARYTGRTVAFFSLEMSKIQLGMRLLACEARLRLSDIRRGEVEHAAYGRMMDASESLRQVPLLIDDTSVLTVLDLRSRTTRLHRDDNLAMVVVDYLQLLRSPRRHDNRTQEISEISRELKALAKELNVPVIALSQLNRDIEKRGGDQPQLSDIRESGQLEQDADLVMFIHKEPKPEGQTQHNPNNNVHQLLIAKQRNGATGVVDLLFWKEFTRFDSLAQGAL